MRGGHAARLRRVARARDPREQWWMGVGCEVLAYHNQREALAGGHAEWLGARVPRRNAHGIRVHRRVEARVLLKCSLLHYSTSTAAS